MESLFGASPSKVGACAGEAGGGEACSGTPGAGAAAGVSAVAGLGRCRSGGANSMGRTFVVAWTEPGCLPGSTTTRVPTWTRP